MLRKTISIIFLLSAGVMLFLAARGLTYLGPTAGNNDIETLKKRSIEYIRQDRQIDANSAIRTILTDYTTDSKLSAVVYDIAETYRNISKFAKAIELYKFIVENQPESRQAALSQSGLAISNVALGKMDIAAAELEKLKNNYAAEPNIAQLVFNVGDAYYWYKKYSDANNTYTYVIETYPKSEYAMWATMGLAISCIANKDEATAEEYIKRLSADYVDEPRLPEALYYVAGRLGYDKKYEIANGIYGYIADNFPETRWAKDSTFESAKLNVVQYVDVNDEPNTINAIDKFITDFNRPERQAFVYEIARRIDQRNKNEPNDWTETLLNKTITIDPNNVLGKRAAANKIRLEVVGIVKRDGDINDIILGVERIINDFNKVPDTEGNLRMICTKLTTQGHRYRREKNEIKAVESFQIAIWVRQQVIDHFPNSPTHASAYYVTGIDLAQNLHEYEEGIEYFQKVVQNWPVSTLAWGAQFNIARYYEMIKLRDKIKDVQYDLKIIDAYKTGIEKFPDCEAVDFGTLRIANLYYGINQFEEAIIYYQTYLGKRPDDLKVVILNYGDCLEKTGHKDIAILIYQDYLKIADTYDKAITAIKERLAKLGGGVQ